MDLRRGIDLGVVAVVKEIQARARKVKSSGEIAQVGTIAANGDVSVGEMIAKAMDKVGNEGVITVEEARTAETELDVVEGMPPQQLERWLRSGDGPRPNSEFIVSQPISAAISIASFQ